MKLINKIDNLTQSIVFLKLMFESNWKKSILNIVGKTSNSKDNINTVLKNIKENSFNYCYTFEVNGLNIDEDFKIIDIFGKDCWKTIQLKNLGKGGD